MAFLAAGQFVEVDRPAPERAVGPIVRPHVASGRSVTGRLAFGDERADLLLGQRRQPLADVADHPGRPRTVWARGRDRRWSPRSSVSMRNGRTKARGWRKWATPKMMPGNGSPQSCIDPTLGASTRPLGLAGDRGAVRATGEAHREPDVRADRRRATARAGTAGRWQVGRCRRRRCTRAREVVAQADVQAHLPEPTGFRSMA